MHELFQLRVAFYSENLLVNIYKLYRNDCICNLVRIMTSTRFVTAFLSQKSTFFDFLLVTGPYTNLTLQKIKLSNGGFYLGQYGNLGME